MRCPLPPKCFYEHDRNNFDIFDIKPLGKCTVYFKAGNRLKVKEEGNKCFFSS